jgi:hypothetical protein
MPKVNSEILSEMENQLKEKMKERNYSKILGSFRKSQDLPSVQEARIE